MPEASMPSIDRTPHAGDVAVHQQSWQHVPVATDDQLAVPLGDDPASVLVGKEGAVPHR